jgi:N-methylhydantoinase B
MVMDHGATGPQGLLGGEAGGMNKVSVHYSNGDVYTPAHVSKDQGIVLETGDSIDVRTPGGGGYGAPSLRSASLKDQDALREYR